MENLTFVLGLPVILILGGLLMGIAGKPNSINRWAGYRTPRACKNQETWVFANRYFGKLALLSGLITLTFSIGVFIHNELMYWAFGSQGVALVLTCVFTEMALRKEFDKDGNKKQ